MPELPEVETCISGLTPLLLNRRIERVEARRADLRRPLPPDLGQRLTGATVTGLSRRAKYGLVATNRGDTLVFHLGMSGRWRADPDPLGPHDHVVMTVGGRSLALNDPRRFGSLDLVPTAEVARWGPFAAMGPEPLDEAFDGAVLAAAFAGRRRPVKAALLDQRRVAGLGNIYVLEALHRAGIAPARAAGRIGRARLDALALAIKAVLRESIAVGGSTLRDFASPDGEIGYFAKDWRVYGREGEACACGETIRRRVEAGRSTFWCARCQH